MALQRDDLKQVRQRKYLGRDFDSLRSLLLEYARLYYPDKIRDLSETSMGGLLMDLAAYVGDNMSFYLDHQYGELNPGSAVEDSNIERHLNNAGVPIVGAAPALVPVTFFVQIPAINDNDSIVPDESALPKILTNTTLVANNGTSFILAEDIDYASTRSDGSLYADVRVGNKAADGTPLSFILAMSGLCVSGEETTEAVTIGQQFVPFRQLTLAQANISEILSVVDGFGNVYYEVNHLTHDVVYRNVLNTAKDNDIVKDSLKIVPAPYRFTTNVDLSTRRTTMTLGGGNANSLEDDIIPDPSEFAIAFPYKKTFSRIPVNPNQLLQTKTLGVAASNTTLTVTYRYGGGLAHNVPAGSIEAIETLRMVFPGNPTPAVAGAVRSSTEATNRIQASGGEDAPSADDLRDLLPSIKNQQERIVTREDLLARVYTIPSNFGRVFRAAIRSNPNNPLATQLFIVSRNSESKLIVSPDTLKQNLIKFLNPYRMISDAIDILDARIVNLGFSFDVLIDPTLNRSTVLQNILSQLQDFFDIKNFNIDQPIVISDVRNTIFATPGVISINELSFENLTGIVNNRVYSDNVYDVESNTRQGIIFPPGGGIFEVRFPDVDIVGKASV